MEKLRKESCSFLSNRQLEISLGGYPLIHIRSSHPSHPADAFAVSQAVEISWKVAVLRVSPFQSSNAVGDSGLVWNNPKSAASDVRRSDMIYHDMFLCRIFVWYMCKSHKLGNIVLTKSVWIGNIYTCNMYIYIYNYI